MHINRKVLRKGGGVDWERIEERGEPNGKVSDSGPERDPGGGEGK